MYKIGDKVETPIGIGTIKWIDKASKNDDEGFDTLYVSINGFPEIEFNERHIKPYRTAHEKLVEMGFVVVEDNVAWIAYEYKKAEYLIRFCKGSKQVGVYHDIDTNANYRYFGIELSRILTQYLEELEE